MKIYSGLQEAQLPDVAYDPYSAKYLVAWNDFRDNKWSIYGQLITPDGFFFGESFFIQDIAQNCQRPVVIYKSVPGLFWVSGQLLDSNGNLTNSAYNGNITDAAYNAKTDDILVINHEAGSDYIYCYILDANNQSRIDFLIPTTQFTTGCPNCFLKAAYDPVNNRYLIVWVDKESIITYNDIYGQFVDSDGVFIDDQLSIVNDPETQWCPNAIFDDTNNQHLITWLDMGKLMGRFVNTQDEISEQIVPFGIEYDYDLLFDASTSKYLTVYISSDDHKVYGSLLNQDGRLEIDAFPISDKYSWTPKVASHGGNNYLVVYESGYKIYGRFINSSSFASNISVYPLSKDFNNVMIHKLSPPQVFTITNTGNGDLMIGTLSITGENTEEFDIKSDNCSEMTLKQSASCTIDMAFSPSTTGSFHANLIIPSNDSDEPIVTVNLNGGSGADLAGEWLLMNQKCKNAKKGIKCQIKAKLRINNIGTQTNASSHIKFYLSDDGIYDEGDTFLKQLSIGKIKPGKSQTKSFGYSFPYNITAAGKYVIATLDTDNKVMETDKNNNSVSYGPAVP